MQKDILRQADIEKVVERYADMLFRVSFLMLKNESDAQDVVQETFIKYIEKAPIFESSEHEKAWLIRVATNKSKDFLRTRNRFSDIDVETINAFSQDDESAHIMETLMSLPQKYVLVLTLYYIEGYKVDEIAQITGKTSSAIKMRLKKGRELFEERYAKE